MSIVTPDLKSMVKWSSKTVIFVIRRLTSVSSNSVMVVGFLQEFLLQLPQAFVDDLWRQGISLFDHRGDVCLQGFQEVVLFAEHLIDGLNDYLLQVFLIDRPGSADMAGIL